MGAVYVGKGTIVGIDTTNSRYSGTYTDGGGRMKGTITLSAPQGGATLVTGAKVQGGTTIQMTMDWPSNFAGQPQQIMVAGQPVNVAFERIGAIP